MTARSPVRCLFLARRPVDIAGFVALLVVNSVEAIGAALAISTRRTLADVGGKILKLQPAFTHRNAASAVVLKALIFRVAAAIQHRAPDVVKLGFALKMLAIIGGHDGHRKHAHLEIQMNGRENADG